MVMNTPGGNTVSTAQLAVSLLCSLARNLPAADMSIKEVIHRRGTNTACLIPRILNRENGTESPLQVLSFQAKL